MKIVGDVLVLNHTDTKKIINNYISHYDKEINDSKNFRNAVQTELELYGLGDIEYKRIQVGRLE